MRLAVEVVDRRLAGDLLPLVRLVEEFRVVPAQERDTADVLLVLAGEVTDGLVVRLATRAATAARVGRCVVLVAAVVPERHLPALFAAGVVSVLGRGAGVAEVVHAVRASASGNAVLPDRLVRWLVDEVRVTQGEMLASEALAIGGLSRREVEVLRLVALGEDNAVIAARLGFAERTVKRTMTELTVRLGLRNRAHAVAYAMRAGAI